MRTLTLIIKNLYLLFLCIKEGIHSFLFREKILNEFLQKANQDPILKALLHEIEMRKLSLNLLPAILTTFSEAAMSLKTGITSELSISPKLIQDFLKNDRGLEVIQFSLSHELGHFDQISSEIELAKERKKTCKIKRNCLYTELSASKKGVEILEKITDKKTAKDAWIKFKKSSLFQCAECALFLVENTSRCPRLNELLKEMELIIQEKSISL